LELINILIYQRINNVSMIHVKLLIVIITLK